MEAFGILLSMTLFNVAMIVIFEIWGEKTPVVIDENTVLKTDYDYDDDYDSHDYNKTDSL